MLLLSFKIIAWGARKSDHHYALILGKNDCFKVKNGSSGLRERFGMNVAAFRDV